MIPDAKPGLEERLRKMADTFTYSAMELYAKRMEGVAATCAADADLMHEAADEIARLTAERDALRDQVETLEIGYRGFP